MSRTDEDTGAALAISLFTILIVTSLSIAILGSVASQLGPAQFGMKNTRTAHAAEAGIDTALGKFRTALSLNPADNTTYIGDRRLLPCQAGTSTGIVAGDLAASPGELGFVVTIRYFSEDPSGENAAWRDANDLQCASTGGPTLTPTFAIVSSAAVGGGVGRADGDDVASRTLETIYDFQITNANVLGGLIHNYYDGNASTRDLCFDAGTDAPAQGTPLRVQSCVPGAAQQLFSWRSDYTIVLSATQGTSATSGMCVTAVPTSGTIYTTLRTCNGSYSQKWGYTDNGGFAGQLDYNPPTNTSRTNYCMYIVTDNTPGSQVAAATSQCGGNSRTSTWRPEPRVGAGHAGAISGAVENQPVQWVNFAEFGRCYDVTNWQTTWPFMIAYPCKQEPTGYVGWNQTLVWAGDAASGHLYTVSTVSNRSYQQALASGGLRYCATAPLTNGGYVTMQVCSTTQVRHDWHVNRDTGNYTTSYTIVDNLGRCMAVGAPALGYGVALQQWSTIVSETCDGSSRQKWNAPPAIAPSGLRDTTEPID